MRSASVLHTLLQKSLLRSPVRVGSVLVFLHPCQIFRVLLHLHEGLALKPAEVHLLQPVHRNELCPGKEHPRRLGGALQRVT